MPNRVEMQIIQDGLDEIRGPGFPLINEWEQKFVKDLARYEPDRPLSPAQRKTLVNINHKLMGVD